MRRTREEHGVRWSAASDVKQGQVLVCDHAGLVINQFSLNMIAVGVFDEDVAEERVLAVRPP